MNATPAISIVSAVYNVESFLGEFVRSVLRQDVGFRHNIQLVLVDDGSTDSSGVICDRYARKHPNNIVVLHQANQRQAAARKNGLALATSPVVNFCDPDDWLSPNACRLALQFLEDHHDCDIVSIPLRQFGDIHADHPLNRKFSDGTRLINLREEWSAIQNHLASSFIRRNALSEFDADSRLVMSEDEKEIIKVLLRNPRLGVVADASYHYRRHQGGTVIQNARNPDALLAKQRHFVMWAAAEAVRRTGTVPKQIQCQLLYAMIPIMSGFPAGLGKATEKELHAEIHSLIDSFEIDVIAKHPHLSPKQKLPLLVKKLGKPGLWSAVAGSYTASFAEASVSGDFYGYEIRSIGVESDGVHVSGLFSYPFESIEDSFQLETATANEIHAKSSPGEFQTSEKIVGIPAFRRRFWGFTLPVDGEKSLGVLFRVRGPDGNVAPCPVTYGDCAPLSGNTRTEYFRQCGFLVHGIPPKGFLVHRATFLRHLLAELRYEAWLLLKERSWHSAATIPGRWLAFSGSYFPSWSHQR